MSASDFSPYFSRYRMNCGPVGPIGYLCWRVRSNVNSTRDKLDGTRLFRNYSRSAKNPPVFSPIEFARNEGFFLGGGGESLAAARGKSTVSKWSGDKLRGAR